jgi:hypothetical protein
MAQEQQIDGKSVAIALDALVAGRTDRLVWAALDAENNALAAALDEGRLRGAELHLARVEALTAEVGRRVAAKSRTSDWCAGRRASYLKQPSNT